MTSPTFMDNKFFTKTKSYPFGISRFQSEYIGERHAAGGSDEGVVCIGELPQGVRVCIWEGNKSSLIEAAGNVRAAALETG